MALLELLDPGQYKRGGATPLDVPDLHQSSRADSSRIVLLGSRSQNSSVRLPQQTRSRELTTAAREVKPDMKDIEAQPVTQVTVERRAALELDDRLPPMTSSMHLDWVTSPACHLRHHRLHRQVRQHRPSQRFRPHLST
eukprot:3212555-Amphidinium_carterae.2